MSVAEAGKWLEALLDANPTDRKTSSGYALSGSPSLFQGTDDTVIFDNH